MTTNYEVPEPILNAPFEEPAWHWSWKRRIADKRPGRRLAGYFYRDRTRRNRRAGSTRGEWVELHLVNLVRDRIKAWRDQGWPASPHDAGVAELLAARRPQHRLFFAQVEAAETIIFLNERGRTSSRASTCRATSPATTADRRYAGFRRYACKMATGAGKTTVMGMLAAWSILNKVNDRSDGRFSDVVLVVCPNVTIRNRLRELDPKEGEASLYRTRDLVPEHLMPDLAKGACSSPTGTYSSRRASRCAEPARASPRRGDRLSCAKA